MCKYNQDLKYAWQLIVYKQTVPSSMLNRVDVGALFAIRPLVYFAFHLHLVVAKNQVAATSMVVQSTLETAYVVQMIAIRPMDYSVCQH